MNRYEYERRLYYIISEIDPEDREAFIAKFQQDAMNPVALYGWNMWLGFLGVDRFVVGDIVAGVFKLLTLGGLGVWQIVDCFLIGNRARTKNMELVERILREF